MPKLVTGNGKNYSSAVKLGEAQIAPFELKAARTPEETHIEPPSCGFEIIFVSDFINGESIPELLEMQLAPIV